MLCQGRKGVLSKSQLYQYPYYSICGAVTNSSKYNYAIPYGSDFLKHAHLLLWSDLPALGKYHLAKHAMHTKQFPEKLFVRRNPTRWM